MGPWDHKITNFLIKDPKREKSIPACNHWLHHVTESVLTIMMSIMQNIKSCQNADGRCLYTLGQHTAAT